MDRYGHTLARFMIGTKSAGQMLIEEGLRGRGAETLKVGASKPGKKKFEDRESIPSALTPPRGRPICGLLATMRASRRMIRTAVSTYQSL